MATIPQSRPQSRAQSAYASEDVGNIQLLEHINVEIPDQSIATLFYLVGLGFARDPHMMVGLNNMWVNLGENQFHLPTAGRPLAFQGHIGLVTGDLEALQQRLKAVEESLKNTKFSWTAGDGYVDATCPWGNHYRCYAPDYERFGPVQQGIAYVEFPVEPGAAEGIARFYDQVFGAPSRIEQDGGLAAARVSIGQHQELIFRETREPIPPYDGHHIAIYIANFSGPYEWLNERGLITEDVTNHQFRFRQIVDPDSGKPLFTIEHEVRSQRHPLYRRPLVNRTPGQFAEPRRVNGVTVFSTSPVM